MLGCWESLMGIKVISGCPDSHIGTTGLELPSFQDVLIVVFLYHGVLITVVKFRGFCMLSCPVQIIEVSCPDYNYPQFRVS